MGIIGADFTLSLFVELLTFSTLLESAAISGLIVWIRIVFTLNACMGLKFKVFSLSVALSVYALIPII